MQGGAWRGSPRADERQTREGEQLRRQIMAEPDSPARGGTLAPRAARSRENERSWRRARRARPLRALRPGAPRLPAPPGGDDRDADGRRGGAKQVEIVAGAGAIPVHGREQDLARAERLQLAHPRDGLARRRLPAAVHHHGELPVDPLHIDRGDDALAAEALRQPRDQRRVAHRRGVDRDLVGSRPERGAGIGHRADARRRR